MNIVPSYFAHIKGLKEHFKVQIIVYLVNDNNGLLEFGLLFDVLIHLCTFKCIFIESFVNAWSTAYHELDSALLRNKIWANKMIYQTL